MIAHPQPPTPAVRTDVLKLQGAQSATRSPPKARRDCNPRQSTTRPAEKYSMAPGIRSFNRVRPGTAPHLVPEAPEGCIPVSYTHLRAHETSAHL
eukprot:814093-Alexandrium_andersonii.AAC.1